MYSFDNGGANFHAGPECLRSAADVHTAVISPTESSQSLRSAGFHNTEFGKGLFGFGGFAGGTGVGCFETVLGARAGITFEVEDITGDGGSFKARGGHTLTSSQKDIFGRSTKGTESISYRTFAGVIVTTRCCFSRVDRRICCWRDVEPLAFPGLFSVDNSSSSTTTLPALLAEGVDAPFLSLRGGPKPPSTKLTQKEMCVR